VSAENRLRHARALLADFVRQRAQWRAAQARQWPEDPRNARSAEALDQLALWVMELPDSDERLRKIADVCTDETPFLPAGENAARFTARYGYTFTPNADRFLGVFTSLITSVEFRVGRPVSN
jgi:hypothetical protein